MATLPKLLTAASALFLDFDGTLTELAPRPDAVSIHPELPALLMQLHQWLGGAVAIVTGRAQDDIDPMLAPLLLPAAFEHGALRRTPVGMVRQAHAPDLGPSLAAAKALAATHPGLLVEHKATAMALHYRLAPELEALCLKTLSDCVRHDPGLQLLHGKAVIEIKSAQVGKGQAIEAFMNEAPFAGRQPVFAGDDTTDEPGFDAVQRLGGAGIKVGLGASCAQYRIADPAGFRQWLQDAVPTPLTST